MEDISYEVGGREGERERLGRMIYNSMHE